MTAWTSDFKIEDALQKLIDEKLKLYEGANDNIGFFTKIFRWIGSLFSGKYDLYTTYRLIKNGTKDAYSSGDYLGAIPMCKDSLKDYLESKNNSGDKTKTDDKKESAETN